VSQSIGFIEIALDERRSLEGALADLAAKYELYKTPELARMIKEIQAEITLRRKKSELVAGAHRSPTIGANAHHRLS
jgi:hypothetical protein